MSSIPNSRRRWLCQTAALLAGGGAVSLEGHAQWLAGSAPELPSYYPRDYGAMIDAAIIMIENAHKHLEHDAGARLRARATHRRRAPRASSCAPRSRCRSGSHDRRR